MIRKWNRACSRWRKTCIRRLARKYQRVRKIRRFRTCLAVVLCVELLTGAGMLWNRNRPELNLMRREEFCEVELIPKTVADRQDAADAGKTGESGAAGKDEAAKEPGYLWYPAGLESPGGSVLSPEGCNTEAMRPHQAFCLCTKYRIKKCIAIQMPMYYNFF